jgi:hypothetical protein
MAALQGAQWNDGTLFLNGIGIVVTSMTMNGFSTSDIETATLSSTSKGYIQGTFDGGTIEVQGYSIPRPGFNAGDPKLVLPTAGDKTPTPFEFFLSNPEAPISGQFYPLFAGEAYVQSLSIEATVDDVVRLTYVLRITGELVLDVYSI